VLKNIDPVLTGELLKVLDEMGHGDQLVIADRNFPAASTGKPVIHVGEIGVVRTLTAILSVFPLDTFVARPLERMELDSDPLLTNPTIDAVLEAARASHSTALEYGVIPRFDFYERARRASAVVLTLESAPYCDFILTKGVV
jgi:L-fucose mutarotase